MVMWICSGLEDGQHHCMVHPQRLMDPDGYLRILENVLVGTAGNSSEALIYTEIRI